MFEIRINEYWVKPLIISKYHNHFFLERFFKSISKFEFKEKYILKSSSENNNKIYNTAVIILIGERDKKQLKSKFKEFTDKCDDVKLSPYFLQNYPLSYDINLPIPNFKLEYEVVKAMEDYQLN